MTSERTVARLMEDLREKRGTSPCLIWYGPDSERVELSGLVLDNWAAKTANLLVEELDAEAGTTVALDMPPHWRSLSWALAAWQVGAVLLQPDSAPADVVVTTDPQRWEDAVAAPDRLVAVALGALQMSWDGDLPADAVDYAAEVRAHADVYLGVSEPSAEDAALEHAGGNRVSYGQLLEACAEAVRQALPPGADSLAGQTVLVDGRLPLPDVLQLAVGTWAADGAVVLTHPSVQLSDAAVRSERIRHRFGPDPVH